MPKIKTGPPAPHAVIGAGPAGLTAARALALRGEPVRLYEASPEVGGIARTVTADGYRFDLGGHRFFTKSAEVSDLWEAVLGEEMLVRSRRSRIYWRGRFIEYPLRAGDVIRRIGPVELARCGASYARARFPGRGGRVEETFEEWVSARFGRRLYELFFRTYTEKIWGVPCTEIRSEWAAQRIAGLSLWRAAVSSLPRRDGAGVRSLIEEFHYPRLGPGQLWERMAEEIRALGGEVLTEAPIDRLELDARAARVVEIGSGNRSIAPASVISSLPLTVLAAIAGTSVPVAVRRAAAGLRYRDFVLVALIADGEDPFPDNWVYVHEPGIRAGRIQNFRAWSPWMVPAPDRTCVGVEYFCFEGDEVWSASDQELVELATEEIGRLGLVEPEKVIRGHVVRVPKAYPIYDGEYAERIARIRAWLEGIENLHQVGRNGLHRYNNSDHSMLTALRAVENALDGTGHDIWAVNSDDAYHEVAEDPETPYRRAPETPAMRQQEALVQRT